MSLTPFFQKILPRVAVALLAAALVVSCETSKAGDTATGRESAAAADASVERVVLQAYRIIGDRYIYNPDFPRLAAETYRGFASPDSRLTLVTTNPQETTTTDDLPALSA